MTKSMLEKEVKFYITNLDGLKDRLLAVGAVQLQARTREVNLRFDTPDGQLSASGKMLRLRQDNRAILTFKGATSMEEGVRVRPEFEVVVDDINRARDILEGLGYVLTVTYENGAPFISTTGLRSPWTNCLMGISQRSKEQIPAPSKQPPAFLRWTGMPAFKAATLNYLNDSRKTAIYILKLSLSALLHRSPYRGTTWV